MSALTPRRPVPELNLPLASGGQFELAEARPENFTLLLFYRGYHCPICKTQLADLQDHLPKFEERGVKVVAISMDGEERANKSKEEWGLADLDIAYGLSERAARAYGLYISSALDGTEEPDRFSEPGLFLVKPDGTLYLTVVQNAPFTRPPMDELLQGIDYALNKDYPARGTVVEEMAAA